MPSGLSNIPYISATPEFLTVQRKAEDEFIVVASNHLYDLLSDEEICDLVSAAKNSPHLAAQALTTAARLRAKALNVSLNIEDTGPFEDVTVTVFFLRLSERWRRSTSALCDSLQNLVDKLAEHKGEVRTSTKEACESPIEEGDHESPDEGPQGGLLGPTRRTPSPTTNQEGVKQTSGTPPAPAPEVCLRDSLHSFNGHPLKGWVGGGAGGF